MRKQLKNRWPSALLCGFGVAFTFFFFSPMDIFVGNKTEFLFSFSDIVGYLALFSVCAFLLIGSLILFIPEKAYPVAFGIVFWLIVMGYVQGTFLNIGIGSLLADDVGSPISPAFVVFDTALWILTLAGSIIGALYMKKVDMFKTVSLVILFVICGMQLVGCVSVIPKVSSTEQETNAETETDEESETEARTDAQSETQTEAETENETLYLTSAGLTDVSSGKNIIIFLVDRFDISYYRDLLEFDEDFFKPLTGFTCFTDNVSRFSRTYPAVAGMITGIPNDFSRNAEEYFEYAYQNSPFLNDLKQNGYSIRLYTSDYYSYRDAAALLGVANNITGSTGYIIQDTAELTGNMLALSAYRALPIVMKSIVKVSSGTFSEAVTYSGDEPAFKTSDYITCAALSAGLNVNDIYGKNSYVFIHFNGCHSPYRLDENAEYTGSGNSLDASRGVFKTIYGYIDELKKLGLYENSTIIITGDHPTPVDDYVEPSEPRLTALFVKPAGKSSEPLATSTAQVSEENLIPTLVKSAGLHTSNRYGDGYFDIPEEKNTERHHYFEITYDNGSSALVDFTVIGPGDNFDNWTVTSTQKIGWLYK